MSLLARHNDSYAWTVSELNTAIKEELQRSFPGKLWLQGEVGRLSIQSASRHVYTDLKDSRNSIHAVFFNGAEIIQKLEIKAGDLVMVCGSVGFYPPTGQSQFLIEQIIPAKQKGSRMQQYYAIREQLQKEGLFALERKKPLPSFPKCIAVITSTSKGAAAVNDFVSTIFKKMPNAHLRIVPAPMQGDGAAAKITAAVQFLNHHKACDVIVITRGGGSMDDLWEFNDATLARCVAASAIPVVSAIGHEIDKTILDYVADVSVITPTHAADKVSEVAVNMSIRLQHAAQALNRAMLLQLSTLRNRLLPLQNCPYLRRPQDLYLPQQQRLDLAILRLNELLPAVIENSKRRLEDLQRRLPVAMKMRLMQWQHRQEQLQRGLNALNPTAVLQRGYAILLNDQGQAIRTPEEAPAGTHLQARIAQGSLAVTVDEQA